METEWLHYCAVSLPLSIMCRRFAQRQKFKGQVSRQGRKRRSIHRERRAGVFDVGAFCQLQRACLPDTGRSSMQAAGSSGAVKHPAGAQRCRPASDKELHAAAHYNLQLRRGNHSCIHSAKQGHHSSTGTVTTLARPSVPLICANAWKHRS